MFSVAWIFERLIEAAASSLVLFTLASVAVLCCRQPVRRAQIIILTLAGSVLAPLLTMLPGLPHWSLPGVAEFVRIPSGVALDRNSHEFRYEDPNADQITASAAGSDDPTELIERESGVGWPGLNPLGSPGGEPARSTRHVVRSGSQSDSDSLGDAGTLHPPGLRSAPFPATQVPGLPKGSGPGHPAAGIALEVNLAPWIVGGYLLGAAILATWWVLGFAGLRRLLRTARPAPECCRKLLREIAGPAADHVRLLISPRAPQPFTFGWLKPVIVLPEEMIVLGTVIDETFGRSETNVHQRPFPSPLGGEGLGVRGVGRVAAAPLTPGPSPPRGEGSPDFPPPAPIGHSQPGRRANSLPRDKPLISGRPWCSSLGSDGEPQPGACSPELAWSLVHEWSHVARGDVRVWSFAGLVRLVYFYQPLCWWLRRELRLCQDYLADAAAAAKSSPETYAEFLAVRGVGRPLAVGLGIAGRKSELYRRIAMLVQKRRSLETRCPRWWTVAAATAAIALVVLAATCGSKPESLAAADSGLGRGSAGSGTRESSEKPHAGPLNSNVSNDAIGNTPTNGELLELGDSTDTEDQDTTVAEPTQPTDKQAVFTARNVPESETKQKLLDGLFARATAIKSGRFETNVFRSRDGINAKIRRRFVVSGESWSRALVTKENSGHSETEELDIVRDGHRFTLTRPIVTGTGKSRLAINWPTSVVNADDPSASPPLQAGTIWYRATLQYLRDHSNSAHLRPTAIVNETIAHVIEWSIPADAAKAAFFRLNNLLSGGGIYRVYILDRLGFALARIEYVDRFGTAQYVFDFSEFQEAAPGIHFPRKVQIQEAGEIVHMDILEAANVNEPIDDREFVLKIPPRTQVHDARPHLGDTTGPPPANYDARKYPLRNFWTGAEYPDGLPAAMLAEMDRDVVSPEEFSESQKTTSKSRANQPDSPSVVGTPVKTSKNMAKKTEGEATAVEKTAVTSVSVQNVPDKARLSYGGKNFSAWRDELLFELEPQSRMKALHALGELGANGYAEEAAAAIAEVLKTGPDTNQYVYDAACSALARLGAVGIHPLESQLRHSVATHRLIALNALIRLAGKTEAVIQALLQTAGDDDAGIRATACGALAQNFLSSAGVVEVLVAALKGDEKNVRSNVLNAVQHSKPPMDKALELLKTALHDKDDELRSVAAYLFATRAPASAEHAALLHQVLLNSTYECVTKFLDLFRNPPTVPSPGIAEMVVPTLIAIIESNDPNPKLSARLVESSLQALNIVAHEQAALAAVPALIRGVRGEIPATTDPDRFSIVRSLFAKTLGRIGPGAAEALPALKDLQDSELKSQVNRAEVRADIAAAIRRIEGKKK